MLKIRLIFAFALVALFSSAFGDEKYLDVILRDFNSNDPGFEEFDTDKNASGECAGSNPNNKNSQATPANGICFSGSNYIPCNEGGTQLQYGHTENCDNWATNNGYPKRPPNNKCRWFCNGPDQKGFNCSAWKNDVYVTKGIVQEFLFYDKNNCNGDDIMGKEGDPDYIRYRYCARPQKGNGACYGANVESWFTDGSHTRVYRDMITLKSVGNVYEINHDYNTYTKWWKDQEEDNGYFPLDKFENEKDFYGRAPFNAQSIRVWCPAGGNQDPAPDPAVCTAWRNAGGPRNNPNAARQVAQQNGVLNRLHNYSFSMAGSGEFRYAEGSNDVFEFIGDDDMWIFIDGKLVKDLGGNHLAAPAKINIGEYAKSEKWANNSKHAVNFYYLDRQTDGSNMKLRMALTDLSDPRFGAPRILKAETTQKQDGSSSTIIYVSNKLDEETIKQFVGTNEFPIVISKIGGGKTLYGFKIESISDPQNMGSEGYAYTITGSVCKSKTVCGKDENGSLIISSGDSLSFNVMLDNLKDGGYTVFDGLALQGDSWLIKSASNKTPATTKNWAINTTDLPPTDFKPDIPDKIPVKPPFIIAEGPNVGDDQGDRTVPGGAGGSVGSFIPNLDGKFQKPNHVWDPKTGTMVDFPPGAGNNSDVHGFGVVGKQIPTQRAGELILTVFPSTNATTYQAWLGDPLKQKLFGLPPTVKNPETGAWWGIADPSKEAEHNGIQTGGYQFVKNGFPNESSTKGNIKIAPTRCTTIFDEKGEPRINCLNFSLVAKQPFQLAVTVYDQLGNFVTQYRETLTEQEFRNVVQAPNYISSNVNRNGQSAGCEQPNNNNYGAPTTLTTNGQINVNVNIYPFSTAGRRFGNGVYIVKIDRVDLPFKDGEKDPYGNGYTCASAGGGNATRISPSFIRYHADQKFGWMRTNQK